MAKASGTTRTRSTDANRLPQGRNSGSVYAQLREELRLSVLQTGQPGDRVPSERQLAQQFGVSPITISRAMQELQSEGSIERIVGKGTFISKAPLLGDASARNGVAPLPPTTAPSWEWQLSPEDPGRDALVPYVWLLASLGSLRNESRSNEFWSHRLTSHVERFVQKIGGRTAVTDQEAVLADDIAVTTQEMMAQGVNSVVFLVDTPVSTNKLWAHQFLRMQSQTATRRLAVTQVSFGNAARFPFDTVRFNGEQGVFLATSHLLGLGHRNVAFLSPSPDTEWVSDRIRGFWRALEMGGIEGTEERVFYATSVAKGNESWVWAGRDAGERLLQNRQFSAVVVANDAMARAFIELANEKGLSVPGDLSVVGFDDWHYSSAFGLTTLHPPIEAMGEVTASLAMKRLAQPFEQGHVEVVLDPTLVVRSSTRAI